MYKNSLKNDAVDLRKKGFSYSHISACLRVSKSTLSLWLRDVDFFPNDYTRHVISNSQKKAIAVSRADKAFSINAAQEYSKEVLGKLSERDIFVLGLGIYIGEGSKSQNIVRIVNSDPKIVRFSIFWLKKCFKITDSNLKVRIHAYPNTDQALALKFWMKELNLDRDHFHIFSIDARTNKSKRNNRVLPWGTAHLTVVSNGEKNFGVLLHRKILATIDRALNMRD